MRRVVARALAAALLLSATVAGAEPSVRVAVLPVVVHSIGADRLPAARHRRHALDAPRAAPGRRVVRVADAAQATLDPEAARAGGAGGGRVLRRVRLVHPLRRRCEPRPPLRAGAGRRRRGRALDLRAGGQHRRDHPAPRRRRGAGRPLRGLAGSRGAAVAAGPGAPALQGPAALRTPAARSTRCASRVERLESAIYGRQGAQPAPGPRRGRRRPHRWRRARSRPRPRRGRVPGELATIRAPRTGATEAA